MKPYERYLSLLFCFDLNLDRVQREHLAVNDLNPPDSTLTSLTSQTGCGGTKNIVKPTQRLPDTVALINQLTVKTTCIFVPKSTESTMNEFGVDYSTMATDGAGLQDGPSTFLINTTRDYSTHLGLLHA